MTHALKIQIANLVSLKAQLNYVEDVLTNNLETWEAKEYNALKVDYIKEIKELTSHIEMCKSL